MMFRLITSIITIHWILMVPTITAQDITITPARYENVFYDGQPPIAINPQMNAMSPSENMTNNQIRISNATVTLESTPNIQRMEQRDCLCNANIYGTCSVESATIIDILTNSTMVGTVNLTQSGYYSFYGTGLLKYEQDLRLYNLPNNMIVSICFRIKPNTRGWLITSISTTGNDMIYGLYLYADVNRIEFRCKSSENTYISLFYDGILISYGTWQNLILQVIYPSVTLYLNGEINYAKTLTLPQDLYMINNMVSNIYIGCTQNVVANECFNGDIASVMIRSGVLDLAKISYALDDIVENPNQPDAQGIIHFDSPLSSMIVRQEVVPYRLTNNMTISVQIQQRSNNDGTILGRNADSGRNTDYALISRGSDDIIEFQYGGSQGSSLDDKTILDFNLTSHKITVDDGKWHNLTLHIEYPIATLHIDNVIIEQQMPGPIFVNQQSDQFTLIFGRFAQSSSRILIFKGSMRQIIIRPGIITLDQIHCLQSGCQECRCFSQCTLKCQKQAICKQDLYQYRSCDMLKQGLDIRQMIQQTATNVYLDVDNSLIFNGSVAYTVSNAAFSSSLNNQFTLSTWLWLLPMANATQHRYIISKLFQNQVIFALSLFSNHTVNLALGERNITFTLVQGIDDERWHQLTVSVDKGIVSLYIDGHLVDNQSTEGNIINDSNGSIVVGALLESSNKMVGYYIGRLKSLVFDNQTSSAVAIQCLMTCGQQLFINPPINTTGSVMMASYDQQTSKLMIQGSETMQTYLNILRTTYYANSYSSPNPISVVTAQIQLYQDGLRAVNLTSLTSFHFKLVNNIAPIVDLSGPATNSFDYTTDFTENQPAVPVASSSARIFIRNRLLTNMDSLIIQLYNFPDGNHDVIFFQSDPSLIANQLNVDTSNDFHSININGSSTVVDYQNHLLRIYYNNTRDEPTCLSRRIDFYATRGDQRSYITSTTVNVYGFNDIKPVFNQTSYTTSIVEDSPQGLEVIQVIATDADHCRGDTITYEIIQGNEEGKFSINNATGLIKTIQSLDYEQQSLYILNVSATNYDEQNILRDYTTVTISILNINDNGFVIRLNGIQPQYDVPFNVTGYNATKDYLVQFNNTMPEQDIPIVGSQFTINDGDGLNPYIISMDITLNGINNFDYEYLILNQSLLQQYDIQIQPINNQINGQKVISLSGNASHAAYPQILKSLMYYTNATQLIGSERTIEFLASDGQFQSPISRTYIQIIHYDKFRPQLTTTQDRFSFVENSKPLAIAETLQITDLDYPFFNLTSASAFIVNPSASCPITAILQLSCRHSDDIQRCSASCAQNLQVDSTKAPELDFDYNYAENRLTLTGSAAPSVYQDILSTLTYTNIAIEPNGMPRQIQIIARDRIYTSLPISINIDIRLKNDLSPILRLNGFQSLSDTGIPEFRPDQDYLTNYNDVYNGTASTSPAMVSIIGPNAVISDSDNQYQERNNIINATITLMGIENVGKERLLLTSSIPATHTISYPANPDFSQFQVNIVGNSSHQEYLQIFQLFRYQSIAVEPLAGSLRSISFVVNDGKHESVPSFTYIRIVHHDKLRPTVTLVTTQWTYMQSSQVLSIAEDISITDLDEPQFPLTQAVIEVVHPLANCSHPVSIEYGCRKQFDSQIGRHCDGLSVNFQVGLCILSCGQYLQVRLPNHNTSQSSSIKVHVESPTRLVIKGNGTSSEYQQILSTLTFADYSYELKTTRRKVQISIRDTNNFDSPTSIDIDVVNNDNHRPYIRSARRTFTLLPTDMPILQVGQLGPMTIINPTQQLISELIVTLSSVVGLDQENISVIMPDNETISHQQKITYNVTAQTTTYDQIIQSLTYTDGQGIMRPGCRIITSTLIDSLGNSGIPLDLFISVLPYPSSLLTITFNRSADLNYFPFKLNRLYLSLQISLRIVNTLPNSSIASLVMRGVTISLTGSSLTDGNYIAVDERLISRFGLTLSASSDAHNINITGVALARDYQLVLDTLYYVNNHTVNVPPEYRYVQIALQNINGSIQQAPDITIFVHPIHFYLTCPKSITFVIQVTPLPFYPLRQIHFRSELGDHDLFVNATVQLQIYPNTGGTLIYNGTDTKEVDIMQQSSFTEYRDTLNQVQYINQWPLSFNTKQNLTISLSKMFEMHTCTIEMNITRPYFPYIDLNGPSNIGNAYTTTAEYANASSMPIKISHPDTVIDNQPLSAINQFYVKVQITKQSTDGTLGMTLCNGNLTGGCRIGRFTNQTLWCQCDGNLDNAMITADLNPVGDTLYLRQNISQPWNNETFTLLLRDSIVFTTGLMAPVNNLTTARITFSVNYNGNMSIPSVATIIFLTMSLNPTICLDPNQNCNYQPQISETNTCVNIVPPTMQLTYNYLLSNVTISLRRHDPEQMLIINQTNGFDILQPSQGVVIVKSIEQAISPERFIIPLRNLQYCYPKVEDIITNQPDISNKFIDITATASNGAESNTVQSIVTIDRSCLRQVVVQVENYQQLQNVSPCQQVQELLISCLRDQGNCNISSLKPLENLTVIRNRLHILGLPINQLLGLENIKQLGGMVIFNNPQLTSLGAIAANNAAQNSIFVANTVSTVVIRDNNQLTDVSILRQATIVAGHLKIERNQNLDDLSAFSAIEEIRGNLFISSLSISNLDALRNLKLIGGSLYLFQNPNLININGLRNVQSIGGIVFVMMNNVLQNLDGISNITTIGQRVYIQLNSNLCFTGKESVNNLHHWQSIQPPAAAKLNFAAYNGNGNCPAFRNCNSFGNPCSIFTNHTHCQNENQGYICSNSVN